MKEIFMLTRNRKLFSESFFCLLLCFSGLLTRGQTTLSTTSLLTNDDTAAVVTFNFQNTNAYPVLITGLSGILNVYGASDIQLWYKTTAISGSPGAISTGNGWTMASSSSVLGIANSSTGTTQTLLNNINLLIPAGSTYGIAVAGYAGITGTLRVDAASGTTTVSGGGCTLSLGTGAGFSGNDIPPAAPTEAARGWMGQLTFIPGSNCTGTPAAPAISGPATICASALFTLTASGYSMGPGIGYQWQYFNTTSGTWVDIAGATNAASYTATAGITAATQFRLRSSCSFSSAQSFSNTVTVGIGAGLLSGMYTINKDAPSTTTNFVSLTAAAAALSCGVSGPVTFNVAPGSAPYEEQVVFRKAPGSSAVNKIRLNGHGAIVQSNTSLAQPAIVQLKGISYFTIDSLNLRSLANASSCVGYMLSDTLRYDSLVRCFVDVSSIENNATFTTGGISLGTFFNTANDSSSISYCYIGRNHILGTTGPGGANYGVINGNNGAANIDNLDTSNIIDRNLIENMHTYGVYSFSSNGIKVTNNEIHRKNKTVNSTFYGIICWDGWWNNAMSNNTLIEISGNRIHDPALSNLNNYVFYGIYTGSWNNANTQANKFLIYNNAIYNVNANSGTNYGIAIWNDNINNSNEDTFLVYHNTISINVTGNTAACSGIYYNDFSTNSVLPNTIHLKNNLITIGGSSASATSNNYGINFNNLNNNNFIVEQQRNNVYMSATPAANQFFSRRSNVNYATLASYQAAYPTLETGSITVNPQYTSELTGDLTPLNMALVGNGVNLQSIVPRDINGKFRSANPMPGAFEMGMDAGVTALLSPTGTFCSSVKTVSVSIKNHGPLTISNVQIGWSLNGVAQTPVTYTGTLLPANNATVTLGTGLFLPNTPVEIKAWTYMPNNLQDAVPSNDTLITSAQCSSSIPVNLGADDTICTGNTITLDAGYPGWSHTWDNSSNAQTRTVSVAGTYYVKVTALDGCLGFDTFTLSLRALPVVDLGPDREICLGETTTFDAGHPGATYLWDDGSANQTRTVDTAGYYEAQVTDQYGCTGVDNVEVMMKDIPAADGINATHAETGLYTFYPINPRYTLTYRWNFGDGSPEEEGYFVQHAYTALGIYTVTLHMVGECTGLIIDISRTVDVFSLPGTTGIGQVATDGDIILYPNPSQDKITINNHSNDGMMQLIVYNVLGQAVIKQAAQSRTTHEIKVSSLSGGMYTLRIETEKGTVLRKFEVQR
jgi:hypothetical protein